MDFNKIKLLKKEELLHKLKQSGFREVANILEDKDIDGQKLIDIREFEIFKWKLTPPQKRNLFDCIKKIKDKPAILMIQDKPKLREKPIPVTNKKPVKVPQSNENFKNRLQDILGSSGSTVGSSATFPKLVKSRPLPSTENERKPFSKPLPQPPPPSPPPKRDVVKNTNTVTKKGPMPLPKAAAPEPSKQINEEDAYYLQMCPPPPPPNPPKQDDYYLAPINVPLSQNKNKSVAFPKKKMSNEVHSTEPFTRKSFNKVHPPQDEDVEETYENVEDTSKLFPPRNIIRNRSMPDISDVKSPMDIIDDDNAVYEFPAEISNKIPVSVPKTTIKDLGSHVVVVTENTSQQESKFSILTSKLNIFKNLTKTKNLYENFDIQGEKSLPTEIPIKNRPLPQIPSSSKVDKPRPITLFSRPFPPPRDISPESHTQESHDGSHDESLDESPDEGHDNYVELTNTETEKHSARQNVKKQLESDDENQIYENASRIQDDVDDDEQQIYENTERKTESSDDDQQIYENPGEVHEYNPSKIVRTKKYVDEAASPKQTLPKNFQEKPENNSVHGLALLLSKKLMERDQKLQYQPSIEESDSEFDDEDPPIYGNVTDDNENDLPVVPDDKVMEINTRHDNIPVPEVKRTPIYKSPLPDIPVSAQKTAIGARGPAPLPKMWQDVPLTQATPIKKFNSRSLPKEEQIVKRNSTLGLPKPLYSSYEHHTMKNENNNQQRPEMKLPEKEEKNQGDNIFNLSDEPFFRNTDRKGAKQILSKLGNGAFLFRPSQTYFLVLTVKHNKKFTILE